MYIKRIDFIENVNIGDTVVGNRSFTLTVSAIGKLHLLGIDKNEKEHCVSYDTVYKYNNFIIEENKQVYTKRIKK